VRRLPLRSDLFVAERDELRTTATPSARRKIAQSRTFPFNRSSPAASRMSSLWVPWHR